MNGEASRNAANNRAEHGLYFKENFSRMFPGMEWAHFDTVDALLREIKWEELETQKAKMVRLLIEKKRLFAFKGYYLVAIDATGITSYDQQQCDKLLYKKSKNGKVTYLNIMLEAKIVNPDGLSISIDSEP